jgi:hypothetical protein
MMDPDKTSLPQSQVGFINFLCLPLFQEVAMLFPAMEVCVRQMQTNKDQWQQMENTLKEKREKEAAQHSTTTTTTSSNSTPNNSSSSVPTPQNTGKDMKKS